MFSSLQKSDAMLSTATEKNYFWQVFRNNMLHKSGCESDMNKPLSKKKNLENIDRNKKWKVVVLVKWRYLTECENKLKGGKEELPLAVNFHRFLFETATDTISDTNEMTMNLITL